MSYIKKNCFKPFPTYKKYQADTSLYMKTSRHKHGTSLYMKKSRWKISIHEGVLIEKVENIVTNREIARFQKSSAALASESIFMWERVKRTITFALLGFYAVF